MNRIQKIIRDAFEEKQFWVAVNEDGTVWIYDREPALLDFSWGAADKAHIRLSKIKDKNNPVVKHWTASLTKFKMISNEDWSK